MDTVPPSSADSANPVRPETARERQHRLAQEADGIAEARGEIAAGRTVDAAEVDAWIDSLDTDHELPIPCSGR